MMVSSTYLVALVAVLGSAVTSAHAHRNAGAEIKARLDRRAVGAKGTLGGPAAGCYSLPSDDSFTQPDGNIDIDVNGVTESQPAAYDTYMTANRCALACVPLKKLVVAVAGSECYCGDLYPMKSLQVDDSKCDAKCAGFGDLMCGDALQEYYSFWPSGIRSNIANAEDPTASSSSVASASKASASSASKTSKQTATPVQTTLEGGRTVFVTPTAAAATATSAAATSDAAEDENKGPNKVGIAVGVVVGVLVLAAAAGAFYFWHRKTRRNELEEEYKRQAAIAAFTSPTTETSSYDTRLDTAALRRMSDGSIADNQDYSRRILKVTNA